jgi:hypothetical protein
MRTSLLVASLVLLLGCKSREIDRRLDQLSTLKDHMCACKDDACTDKVQQEWRVWNHGSAANAALDHDQETRFEELANGMNDCRTKIFESGRNDGGR